MTAYTDADAIAAKLGVTFTPAQEAQAAVVAQAVTAWIDHTTGQSWQDGSPIAAELLPIIAPPCLPATASVYLLHRPALTITSVAVRESYANATETVLDPSEYELVDPQNGVLRLNSYWHSWWYGTNTLAVVGYTCGTAVPADLAFAATILASDFMTSTLAPESAGVESIAVARNDISIRYAGSTGNESAEVKRALSIVQSYCPLVIA
jgi:hypothetical protein